MEELIQRLFEWADNSLAICAEMYIYKLILFSDIKQDTSCDKIIRKNGGDFELDSISKQNTCSVFKKHSSPHFLQENFLSWDIGKGISFLPSCSEILPKVKG